MIKRIFFTVFLFFIVKIVPANSVVIINDTDDWSGKIHAEKEGFITYAMVQWIQTGANNNPGTNHLFYQDYSPIITNTGTNIVTCSFIDLGWNWQVPGKVIDDSITFKTSQQIADVGVAQGGGKKTTEKPSNFGSVVPLKDGKPQTILIGPENVDFTMTIRRVGLQNSIAIGFWYAGTTVSVLGYAGFIAPLPSAIASVSAGTIGLIVGFVIPTEDVVILDTITTNQVNVASGLRTKIVSGHTQRAWFKNIKYYSDENKDGLADGPLIDGTIEYNTDFTRYARLEIDDPALND